MKKLILFLLITLTTNAQIKGIVKDSITKQPIAYAAVLIENTKTGVNTESDGTFNIDYKGTEKKLIISALGYQEKKVIATNTNEIYLSPKPNLIEEISIQSKLQTSEIIVGDYKKTDFGFGNGGFKHMWG
jgi:CarboxypepD_reg-like domain